MFARRNWRVLAVQGTVAGAVVLLYCYLSFAPTGYTRLIVTKEAKESLASANAAMGGEKACEREDATEGVLTIAGGVQAERADLSPFEADQGGTLQADRCDRRARLCSRLRVSTCATRP